MSMMLTDNEHLRLECMKLAIEHIIAKDAIQYAQDMYAFIKDGTLPAYDGEAKSE